MKKTLFFFYEIVNAGAGWDGENRIILKKINGFVKSNIQLHVLEEKLSNREESSNALGIKTMTHRAMAAGMTSQD
jgi:hypothetical protein